MNISFGLFQSCDQLVNQSIHQINHGIGNPSDTIDQLKRLITSIEKNIRDSPSHETSDRIKQFVNISMCRSINSMEIALH